MTLWHRGPRRVSASLTADRFREIHAGWHSSLRMGSHAEGVGLKPTCQGLLRRAEATSISARLSLE
jgi:hypothetical protein